MLQIEGNIQAQMWWQRITMIHFLMDRERWANLISNTIFLVECWTKQNKKERNNSYITSPCNSKQSLLSGCSQRDTASLEAAPHFAR